MPPFTLLRRRKNNHSCYRRDIGISMVEEKFKIPVVLQPDSFELHKPSPDHS
jgi:hypothetical protein